MNKEEFLQSLPAEHRDLIERLIPIVEKYETDLSQGIVQVMGSQMLGYRQDGEFKYAFASEKKHLSFHSMVMYCYPELRERFQSRFQTAKFQKACINVARPAEFDLETFDDFIRESSAYPYPSPLQLQRRAKRS
ncbi:MAG: hypothetical protein KDC43_23570 [Saprospiraceae bacterium]|nr:hypothetical protein [Saprospiraceae bacterium]MCB0626813.1 hypothetical protein [Saprospiraceae bacterium]MCB0678741.1 hypothetical protein [Saprospiraceae bacterium]MCB0683299.1 hypothetical protein [Saprospiraceae bacterium]